ncbi:MAG: hypothetical protein IJ606_05230 [Bacteroidaceae bacterium]|nr:hypothetical protein [Bacteroidaceae bacterium]
MTNNVKYYETSTTTPAVHDHPVPPRRTTLTWAYDFAVDGIYYEKNTDGTSVTVTYKTSSNRGYSGSYDKYGKGSPLERNKLIVDECDCVLAFWDGTSRGTKFTLDYAKEKNKPIKIIQI